MIVVGKQGLISKGNLYYWKYEGAHFERQLKVVCVESNDGYGQLSTGCMV